MVIVHKIFKDNFKWVNKADDEDESNADDRQNDIEPQWVFEPFGNPESLNLIFFIRLILDRLGIY